MRTNCGLITYTQALLVGYTRGMVRRRVESGAWVALAPGVFRSASAPQTEYQRLLAATWAPAVDALASHRSAAWLWELLAHAPDLPETTGAAVRVGRLPGIAV